MGCPKQTATPWSVLMSLVEESGRPRGDGGYPAGIARLSRLASLHGVSCLADFRRFSLKLRRHGKSLSVSVASGEPDQLILNLGKVKHDEDQLGCSHE